MPDSESSAAPPHVYTNWMDPDDAAVYLHTPTDTDFDEEIRVLRLLVARLCADLVGNNAAIARVMSVLCRALVQQATQQSGGSELHDELLSVADACLDQACAGTVPLSLPFDDGEEGDPYGEGDDYGLV